MTMMQSDMQELERTAWRMRLELLGLGVVPLKA